VSAAADNCSTTAAGSLAVCAATRGAMARRPATTATGTAFVMITESQILPHRITQQTTCSLDLARVSFRVCRPEEELEIRSRIGRPVSLREVLSEREKLVELLRIEFDRLLPMSDRFIGVAALGRHDG